MSRKKNRAQGMVTPVKEASVLHAVVPSAEQQAPPFAPAVRPLLHTVTIRLMRTLGSLHMAIILLSTAAVVLFLGSWLESRFDARISQHFVYRTWWFTVLLVLFGVNIFAAAVKKWPWKRHQTGFLITHVGLLTLLAGGILNSIGGVDAEMDLLDSPLHEVQNELKMPQQTRQIMYRDEGMMTVEKWKRLWKLQDRQPTPVDKPERLFARNYPFDPGVLTWGDPAFASQGPLSLRFLNTLANPVTPSWSKTMEDGSKLTVMAYYPHASREQYAEAQEGQGFPAVKIQLGRETLGFQGSWLAQDPEEEDSAHASVGPARVELLGVCPDAVIPDFLNPPPPIELGSKGQLVIRLGDTRETVDVAKELGKTVMIGKTGWQVRLTNYEPAVGAHAPTPTPTNPAIDFALVSPQGIAVRYRLLARGQSAPARLDPPKEGAAPALEPACWYHPPDFRFGQTEERLRGLLQMVQSASGKLYFRTFTGRNHFQLEGAYEVEPYRSYDVWKAMGFKFQVAEHLPRAARKTRFVPAHERPALRREDLFSVLQCRFEGTLTITKREGRQEEALKREFPLATPTVQASSQSERIIVRRELLPNDLLLEEYYTVRYALRMEELGFEIKLLRAESHVDPGTDRDATYTSYVQLLDPPEGGTPTPQASGAWDHAMNWILGDQPPPPGKQVREDVMITMNQPLNYRGYKLYQSNFQRLGQDGTGKTIHRSGFTVGRDPGLWLKYIGSSMLALGITCMFYMRAYFFKPRNRKAAGTV